MSIETVLRNAQSLAEHAKRLGGPYGLMEMIVSREEGMELLEWLCVRHKVEDHPDLQTARMTRDPFPMLADFELHGMKIRAGFVH